MGKLMKYLVCVLFILIISSLSFAGTYTASSPCYNDVNSKLSEIPSTGAHTLNIPATLVTDSCYSDGADVWSSGQILNVGTKNVSIIGDGKDTTIITTASTSVAYIKFGAGDGQRLSKVKYTGLIEFAGTNMRIDNNDIIGSITARSSSSTHPTGVIYKNTFSNTGHILVKPTNTQYTAGTDANALWAQQQSYGSETGIIYIEGNTYYRPSSATGYNNAFDASQGGRLVFRFNTVLSDATASNTATYMEVHSIQGTTQSQEIRAAQRWEVYNNKVTANGGYQWSMVRLRGGTGVVFNNQFIGNWSTYAALFDNVRDYTDTYTGRYCDGSTAPEGWDGNTAEMTGWPCRDQIGRGYDTVQFNYNSPAYNQPLIPAYLWNNVRTDGTTAIAYSVMAQSASHIVANRDYFLADSTNCPANPEGSCTAGVGRGTLANRPASCVAGYNSVTGADVAYYATDKNILYRCTSDNTWEAHFTIEHCPHSLADDGGSCDYSVYGADGYTVTGGAADTTAPTVLSVYVNADTMTINFSESITATSGAAFTLDPSGTDVTVSCPAVSTAATTMACTISRALTAAETVKYAYTGTKVVDTAETPNALAEISATDITGNQTPAEAPTKKLTITKTGSGCIVTSTPSGMNCSGESCEYDYTTGTSVELGSYFVNQGWKSISYSGGCAGGTADLTNDVADCVVTCKEKMIFK